MSYEDHPIHPDLKPLFNSACNATAADHESAYHLLVDEAWDPTERFDTWTAAPFRYGSLKAILLALYRRADNIYGDFLPADEVEYALLTVNHFYHTHARFSLTDSDDQGLLWLTYHYLDNPRTPLAVAEASVQVVQNLTDSRHSYGGRGTASDYAFGRLYATAASDAFTPTLRFRCAEAFGQSAAKYSPHRLMQAIQLADAVRQDDALQQLRERHGDGTDPTFATVLTQRCAQWQETLRQTTGQGSRKTYRAPRRAPV